MFCIYMIFFGLFLGAASPTRLYAENVRSGTIDVYLLVDASNAMEKSGRRALDWVNNAVVHDILIPGDRVQLWSISETPELLFSSTLEHAEDLVKLSRTIDSIQFSAVRADYTAALRKAVEAESERSNRTIIAFTLMIEGYDDGNAGKDNNTTEADVAELLRYSRVDDYPGWKVITIGLGIEPRIKSATASYMEFIEELRNQGQ